MQLRNLGKSGLRVSAVGLGCNNFGGRIDLEASRRVVNRAIDLGITLFDTADAYGLGRSEELVGRALRDRHDGVYVATKVGNFARRLGSPLSYDTPHHIYLCCDASLGRLKRDTIDLYQCHLGDLADPTVFLEAFERLVERGKIRAYGISTNSLAVAQAFNGLGTCAAVQLNYSLLNPAAARDLLPWCAANDIGTLIRGPLAQGLLAGTFTAATRFDDSVRTGWNEGTGREQFLRRLEQVEQVRFLARPDRTLAQAALQWVLAHPAVSCAIPGAKSVAQVTSNAAAADGQLTEDDLARLAALTAGW